MLRNQDRRTIGYLVGILFIFAVAFIALLIIDVTHPDVGWSQREIANRYNAQAGFISLFLWNW